MSNFTLTQEAIEQYQLTTQKFSIHETDEHARRHLGASKIGDDCERALWYSFRWSSTKKAEPRFIRLWHRGHAEEPRFVAMLESIGATVVSHDPKSGKQFRMTTAGGHGGGACDGFVKGIPDFNTLDTWGLAEYKTANDKSFKEMVKSGLRTSKFTYFVQMQVYMKNWKLQQGFFMMVNKDTDELYTEVVSYDAAIADKYTQKMSDIVFADQPGDRISELATYYKCRWCEHKNLCHHLHKAEPNHNCRTCAYSQPIDDGNNGAVWRCQVHEHLFTDNFEPCENYEKHKAFIAPKDVVINLFKKP